MNKKNILLAIIGLIIVLGVLVACNNQPKELLEKSDVSSSYPEKSDEKSSDPNLFTTKTEGESITPNAEIKAEIKIENDYLVPTSPSSETEIKNQVQPFIDDFNEKYPGAYIVKFRWEDVVLGENYTYIIEGVEGNKKYIVKYVGEPFAILGKAERELNDLEVDENGIPSEKELDLDKLVSLNDIYELSQEDNMKRRVVQWIISWKKDFPILEITLIDGNHRTFVIAANAESGEFLK